MSVFANSCATRPDGGLDAFLVFVRHWHRGVFLGFARQRHRDNPDDRVMPTLHANGPRIRGRGVEARGGRRGCRGRGSATLFTRIRNSMLWKDTKATGRRFLISVALLFPAVLLGLHMGMFPYVGSIFSAILFCFSTKSSRFPCCRSCLSRSGSTSWPKSC